MKWILKLKLDLPFVKVSYKYILLKPKNCIYITEDSFVSRFLDLTGDHVRPRRMQSASRIVKSLVDPKNLDDNSSCFIFKRTIEPLT